MQLTIFVLVSCLSLISFGFKLRVFAPEEAIHKKFIGVDEKWNININDIRTEYAISRNGEIYCPYLEKTKELSEFNYLSKYNGPLGALTMDKIQYNFPIDPRNFSFQMHCLFLKMDDVTWFVFEDDHNNNVNNSENTRNCKMRYSIGGYTAAEYDENIHKNLTTFKIEIIS